MCTDRVIGWKGLPFCEWLVADYPYVVDFYLHGGRERLREAVADVANELLGVGFQRSPARGSSKPR